MSKSVEAHIHHLNENEEPYETSEAETQALILARRSLSIVVKDQESLDFASAFLRALKDTRGQIESVFDPLIKEAFDHHRSILQKKRTFTDKLDEAEKMVKPKVTAFLQEQDRLRFQALREAQLAKEKAEKLADQAVDKASILIDRGEFEEATKVMVEASGEVKELKRTEEEVPDAVKAEGITMRTTWSAEVTDLNLLDKKYMVPNMPLLNAIARNTKDQFSIAGAKAVATTTVVPKGERR